MQRNLVHAGEELWELETKNGWYVRAMVESFVCSVELGAFHKTAVATLAVAVLQILTCLLRYNFK